jgi:predicted permease
MHSFLQDLRYGFRMLAKNPGFTVIAVLTLALGIGANTAIFSLLNQVLLHQLPVKDPQRLVVLKSPGPKWGHTWSDGDASEIFSYPLYKGLAKNTLVFDGVLARFEFEASIANHGQTDRGSGELVSGNYFEVLGVRPALGRLLSPADDDVQGAHPVVVLSHGYWRQHFAGNGGVLNQIILVNDTPMTVVGVAQAGFTGIQVGQSPDIFVPMTMKAQMTPVRNGLDDWNDSFLAVIARLKPGMSLERAQAGINVDYRPLLEQQAVDHHFRPGGKDQETFLSKQILLFPGGQGRNTVQRDSGPALKALFAMVALVLLIACTNVANLLLAKGASRQREFAIRSALGATRLQLMRQLIAESFLYALGGGALGLVLGLWLMDVLTQAVVSEAGLQGITGKVDGSILGFAAAATIVSAILFGLIPAWRVARTGVSQSLKDQGTNSSASVSHVRFRKVLVAGQVAFTLLLLAGSAMFTQTLWKLRQQDLGLSPDNLITFSISPELSGYDNAKTIHLADQLRERIATIPGVQSVGSSQIRVLTGTGMSTNLTIEGTQNLEEDDRDVNYDAISAGYFSSLRVPLLEGREFNEGDSAASPKVAIINEATAKEYFPKRNPVGVHFAVGGGNGVKPNIEIVGVVKNDKEQDVRTPYRPYFYLPYSQAERLNGMSFYVRTQQDPLLISSALREAVRQIDANLPVYELKTVARVVDENLFAERVVAALSASFGGLAAILAALGIYGVLSYVVVQRTREIGIRLALGAATGHVRGLVFKEVAWMVLAGALAGIPLAYGLARLSESLLFGVQASNPLVYAASLAAIMAVAFIACYIPSRRATRIDPMVALRHE